MKPISEKKQDLLLDALACIDEDILARGLALRDGTAVPTAEAVGSPRAAEPTPEIPPLYDLTRRPDKPPRKSPWRILAVAAAACLLFCVVPLSLWMVGSFARTSDEAPNTVLTDDDKSGIQDGLTAADEMIGKDPEDGQGENYVPEADAPAETKEETQAPEATETEAAEGTEAPVTHYSPEEWTWNVVSAQNGWVEKDLTVDLSGQATDVLHYTYTATVDTYQGTETEIEAFYGQALSSDDELVLDLYAQYCMSLYTMDYGSHFLLFHPDIVKLRFTSEVEPYSYEYALGRINALMLYMRPYDTVSLDASLLENRLLDGSELSEYLADKQSALAKAGLDTAEITAVRAFTVEGTVTVENRFTADEWGYGSEFYCYEYNGVWYLDDRSLDDDLCIDFALSEIIEGQDYLKPTIYIGTVTAIEEGYIRLDNDYLFTTDDVAYLIETNGISVGDQVSVMHFDFGLPVQYGDSEEGVLYKAADIAFFEVIE